MVLVSRNQILQLLGHAGLRRLFASHGTGGLRAVELDDDDEDDDDGLEGVYGIRAGRWRRRSKPPKSKPPPVPSEEGRKLMNSGIFGSNDYYQDLLKKRKPQLHRRLMARELGTHAALSKRDNRMIAQVTLAKQSAIEYILRTYQGLIPSSKADTIIHYDSRCYSGQFSDDGNFFFSCAQDFKVRMYDTSNPYEWKYYKTVDYPYGQWTITDATLSPDNKYLAYSSIRSTVCLAPTDPNETAEPHHLDFTDMGGRGTRRNFGGYSNFGVGDPTNFYTTLTHMATDLVSSVLW